MADRVKRRYVRQPEVCKVAACDRAPKARSMCLLHYKRWRRHGTPTPRFRGQVVDGNRLCCRCQQDVPVETFRGSWCGDCWAEDNRRRQHERRVREAGGGESFTRREVLDRDGWVCQLCTLEIDPGLTFPHPQSASLDHVIPLARGGSHTRANSQAAHLDCNRRKWANVAEEAA